MTTTVTLGAYPGSSPSPSRREGRQGQVETIQVAGKLLALESTVAEARARLAQLGMALMAEQPSAVASDSLHGRINPVDTPPGQPPSARTTVDTGTLDSTLRKELSTNLGLVRERIKAVCEECMEELARAQRLLKDKEADASARSADRDSMSEYSSPPSTLARKLAASQDGLDPPQSSTLAVTNNS